MFEIFKNKKELLARIKQLEDQRDEDSILYEDLLDSRNNADNKANASENRMLAMTKSRDPVLVEQTAEKLTARIENMYVKSWDSVETRRNAIKNLIEGQINEILTGLQNPK